MLVYTACYSGSMNMTVTNMTEANVTVTGVIPQASTSLLISVCPNGLGFFFSFFLAHTWLGFVFLSFWRIQRMSVFAVSTACMSTVPIPVPVRVFLSALSPSFNAMQHVTQELKLLNIKPWVSMIGQLAGLRWWDRSLYWRGLGTRVAQQSLSASVLVLAYGLLVRNL